MNEAKNGKNKPIYASIIQWLPQNPRIASAEQCAHMHIKNGQADNRETANTNQATSWILQTLQRIEKEIAQLKKNEMNKNGAGKYRKNDRVIYIPRNQKVERVLAAFREDPKEPLKVTILRLIDFAEKYLQRGKLIHEQLQNF